MGSIFGCVLSLMGCEATRSLRRYGARFAIALATTLSASCRSPVNCRVTRCWSARSGIPRT